MPIQIVMCITTLIHKRKKKNIWNVIAKTHWLKKKKTVFTIIEYPSIKLVTFHFYYMNFVKQNNHQQTEFHEILLVKPRIIHQ